MINSRRKRFTAYEGGWKPRSQKTFCDSPR